MENNITEGMINTCKQIVDFTWKTGNKTEIPKSAVKSSLSVYLKLFKQRPERLAKFDKLIQRVVNDYNNSKSEDNEYRIVWLGMKLKSIHLEKDFMPYISESWEDENELEEICKDIVERR